jgi:Trk K+ transport system NAD-binding subunit
VRSAAQLHRAPGELIHVAVRKGHRWAGKQVRTLKMPGDCVLATVLRGDVIHIPSGDLVIQAGDQLVIFCRTDDVERVQSTFKS